MRAMAVDAVTAEVTAALEEAGVEGVLLKGPSIAAWLYEDPAERPYVDTDLLVDPALAPRAREVLERLGFERGFGPLPHPGMEDAASYPWRRGEAVVDLHETLPGATADRARVWRTLRASCAVQDVGGREVLVLGEAARLAHVALHAAHHGPSAEQPLDDLRRARRRASAANWSDARQIAVATGARDAFETGLAVARGAALPESGAMPLALGIERLASAPGPTAKAAMLREEVFPSPEFMRWWTPLARRSRRGLAAAYVWRWAYLARHAPRAVVATRRKRRKSSAKSPEQG